MNKTIELVYKLFGFEYDGYLLRRNKVAIILDDTSGEGYWGSTQNNFLYRFMSKKSHYGVFVMIICTHEVSVLYGNFRGLMSGYCLFQKINLKALENLWNTTLGLETFDFNWNNFKDIYLK